MYLLLSCYTICDQSFRNNFLLVSHICYAFVYEVHIFDQNVHVCLRGEWRGQGGIRIPKKLVLLVSYYYLKKRTSTPQSREYLVKKWVNRFLAISEDLIFDLCICCVSNCTMNGRYVCIYYVLNNTTQHINDICIHTFKQI